MYNLVGKAQTEEFLPLQTPLKSFTGYRLKKLSILIILGSILGAVVIRYFKLNSHSKSNFPLDSQDENFLLVKSGNTGNSKIDNFSKKDSNLVFFEDFRGGASLSSGVWNVERSMDGGGNAQFQYYTDSPQNLYVNSSDGSLRLKPGLFEDMPPINGVSAFDVMTGKCSPYPDCANFKVPDCSSVEGCEGTGNPADILKPTTSARINTKGNFDFTYGRLEIRVRMPRGDWLWPGIWFMPRDSLYGGWPNDGEIDLIETRGNAPGYQARGGPAGRDHVISTLHFMGNIFWKSQGTASGIDWTEDYHVFGLYWSDEELYTYYLGENGEETKMINLSTENGGYKNGFGGPPYGYNATSDHDPMMTPVKVGIYDGLPVNTPFNQPFYIILNVAVGGAQDGCPDPDYWGEDAIWCARCWPNCGQPTNEFYAAKDNWYPTWQLAEANDKLSMAVDWIKVWQ